MAKPGKKAAAETAGQADDAEEIRAYHALGLEVLRRQEQDKSTASKAARQLADEKGVSWDRAKKALIFVQRFSMNGLERVCALRRPDGTPLSIDHIRRVLALKNHRQRLKWLKRAAAERWSSERLSEEIHASSAGKAGVGGPKPKKPRDFGGTLARVSAQTNEWLKLYYELWDHDDCWPPAVGYRISEAPSLVPRISDLRKRVHELGKSVDALGDRLRDVEAMVRSHATPSSAGKAVAGKK